MVMYAGRAAEKGTKHHIFYEPHHPYTKGLLESIPGSSAVGDRLKPIPGQPPSLINLPSGCKFHPRCAYVLDRCLTEEPALHQIGADFTHSSACWLPQSAVGLDGMAETVREETVREGRQGVAVEVAESIAASPEAQS
jgi:oligopeptide/dipeptide ABC transporter ATP-binding protein